MTAPHVLVDGRAMQLDRLIGRGGEGEIYLIAGDTSHAVKLYTIADRLSREDKIAAMIQASLSKKSPLAAFPLAVVRRRDGTFAGFVMRLVGGHRPIHELYAPGSRKQHFPQADYRFLARATTNIAKAFASVHQTGCVVGDINHSGVLVSPKATAVLIDADSFQFTSGGKQFLCKVGVPEYTPPELQGKSLNGVVRTTDHDAFGLAVVIFQMLLMGRHPFIGKPRRGDVPTYEESIRDFRYVYAEDRDVGMDQPPGTPALSDFSPELASLFSKAFSKSALGRRPSAQEWAAALNRFEDSLIQCPDNPLHYGPRDASECPWCEMEKQLQTFLFLPYFGGAAGASTPVPPTANFDLRIIWARIERVQIPLLEQLRPVLQSVSGEPSQAARAAKEMKPKSAVRAGVLLIAAAFAILAIVPKAWFFALFLGGLGVSRFKKRAVTSVEGKPFHDEFILAKTQWYRELDGWRRRIGLAELHDLKQKLVEAKERYATLGDEERRQIQEYRNQRRDRQLRSYLEGFDLARAGIKGIGHAKLAALASYGIDTAADVRYERVMGVPGFGDALSKRLLEWRQRHEHRFVYNSADNDADRREVARIQALAEGKAAQLRATLSSGAQELELRAARLQDVARRPDPILTKIHERIESAKRDLDYLGLAEPSISQPSPPPTRRNATLSGATGSPGSTPARTSTHTAPPPTVGAPSCPRCNSSMRKRLAGRGRNAGHYFWGCSRYPNCKGTRPI